MEDIIFVSKLSNEDIKINFKYIDLFTYMVSALSEIIDSENKSE